MKGNKFSSPTMNIALGGVFLFAGGLAAQAGVFPILGVLVAAFAPDIFLIGLILLSFGTARLLLSNRIAIRLLAIVLSIVMGLNTRLPTLISDLRNGSVSQTQVNAHIEGAVGQPIHLVAQTQELSARRNQYSHAAPECHGDGCLATKGFSTPISWRNYWQEKVKEVTLSSGFSMAKQGELAPTLTVRQDTEGSHSIIHIELTDANGKLLSRYDGRYRQGFPYETKDGIRSDENHQFLALEYLLHGNLLNRVAAMLMPRAEAYPLTLFLKNASHLNHPQGSALGLISGKPPVGGEPASIKVTLEVLEEKTYDPVWIIKEEPLSSISKWSEMAWDKTRGDRCRTLIKPETKGAPLMQTWHLFVNDPSGRKKVRYSGDAFCDPDAIWFLDYVIEKGRTTLTKYSIDGDLIYRISFEKPKEPWGYAGGILIPTFKSNNGYEQFEWWNTNQSGSDRHVRKSMKVRFREPAATPN